MRRLGLIILTNVRTCGVLWGAAVRHRQQTASLVLPPLCRLPACWVYESNLRLYYYFFLAQSCAKHNAACTTTAVFQNGKSWRQPLLKVAAAAAVLLWGEALQHKAYCAVEHCVLKTRPQQVVFEERVSPQGAALTSYWNTSIDLTKDAPLLLSRPRKKTQEPVGLRPENRTHCLMLSIFLSWPFSMSYLLKPAV